MKFMKDHLMEGNATDNSNQDMPVKELLNDPQNLQKVKLIDQQFSQEMKKLDVDVFSLEKKAKKDEAGTTKEMMKPQIFISVFFLVAYFLMLAAIFFVEISDTLNMEKGENSLMGELQILFGVLTAGVGQVLNFWFGGIFKKKEMP